MNDTPDTPPEPKFRRDQEYQDFHYHDEDDVVPADDVDQRRTRQPARRKPPRRPTPRRHYED
jgi:hypothetical protein